MTELARGSVLDRPWGRTLAALGLRGLTGQLTLAEGGKQYHVVFDGGAVVAASSPLAADAAVRIAMTLGLVSSTQVSDLARRQAAQPQRDEVELVAELVKLAPEHAMRLRRRVIAQRAARTFAIDGGEFVVDDRATLPVVEGSALDIRTVIFLGAKSLMSAARLDRELGMMGAWFQLRPDVGDDIRQFGFAEPERALLEPLLVQGAGLAELEAAGVDQRIVRAMVYSLVACNACNVETVARNLARSKVPSVPPDDLDATTFRRDADQVRAALEATTVPSARAIAEATAPPPELAAKPKKSAASRVVDDASAKDVQALIRSRLAILDTKPDHFTLLGVPREAALPQIRTAYFALARQLHPDKLAALGIDDDQRRAQRLFAEVNAAFATLSDPKRRDEYVAILERGGEEAIRAEQAEAEAMTQRILESEEAFRKGEQALRRDQIGAAIRELQRAVELNPEEAEYQAALAWAQFAAAPDKQAVAASTRSALDRAIKQSPKAIAPKFYLGRVERILGRDQDAIRHFQDVLKRSPHHAEAASELRVLEAKQNEKPGGGGLFGKLKR